MGPLPRGIFPVMPQTSSRFYLRISVFIRGHFLSSALSVAASFSPSFTPVAGN
jgi:hypothetical protein